MLLNIACVKRKVKEAGKQASPSFLHALDVKVDKIVNRAIEVSNSHKRLTDAELMEVR